MQKDIQHIKKDEFLSEEMLLKYRQGELLPSEMRRIEGLLEKYPLYADALEGYELLDAEKIRTHADWLKASIQAKTFTKTVYFSQPRIMRIAAAIAFLLVCSFGIYFFAKQSGSVQNEMAQATAVVSEENNPVAALQTEEKTIELPQEAEKNEQPKISERKEIASNQVITSKDDMGKIADGEINKPEIQASLSQAKTGADTTAIVLTEGVKPNQADGVMAEKTDAAAAKPQIISDIIVSKSSPVTEEYKKESEVAGRKSKKSSVKDKQTAEERTTSADLPIANENIKDLLKKEILLFAKEKNETLSGKLLLTFSTSKEGIAENIVIKESPCLSCNELIIRLIKEAKNLTKNELNQTIEIIF